MIKISKHNMSEKLMNLFLKWEEEYINNMQHDTNYVEAWNALIEYLMELEKGKQQS